MKQLGHLPRASWFPVRIVGAPSCQTDWLFTKDPVNQKSPSKALSPGKCVRAMRSFERTGGWWVGLERRWKPAQGYGCTRPAEVIGKWVGSLAFKGSGHICPPHLNREELQEGWLCTCPFSYRPTRTILRTESWGGNLSHGLILKKAWFPFSCAFWKQDAPSTLGKCFMGWVSGNLLFSIISFNKSFSKDRAENWTHSNSVKLLHPS